MSVATTNTAWQDRCCELGEWTSHSLVNRTDRYGCYGDTGPFTASQELSTQLLSQHFANTKTIGLHSTAPTNTCMWLGIDIDNHDGDDTLASSNFEAAIMLLNRLGDLGINGILEDSNGDGGYHLWILFDEPAPTAAVYRFAQWIIGDGDYETFPKQAKLNGKGLGNWLRLPGKHHTLNHWSRLWGDGEWLNFDDSVDLLLNAPKNSTAVLECVPEEPEPVVEPDPEPAPRIQRDASPVVIHEGEGIVAIAERTIDNEPWHKLLEQYGWQLDSTIGAESTWTRPGKSAGTSAKLNFGGNNLFHVFTTGTNLADGKSYGKWRFYCWVNEFGNDQVAAAKQYLPDHVVQEHDRAWRERQYSTGDTPSITTPVDETKSEKQLWQLKSVWDAVSNPAPKREVIIEGLLRRGEVANIIASTKVGKSWLALLLSMRVATGEKWLGRTTVKGRVLLVDNELHDEEIQNRMACVANAAAVQTRDAAPFDYVDLRGEWVGVQEIEEQLARFAPGELTLVVLDAKYRFFSNGMSENSNDDQTAFHNAVDKLAKRLDCAIIMVHHSTKGDQGQKSVTDVGSGGGSQSRAADCHLVIRPHNGGDDLAVLDAAVRSFPPVEPQTIRWGFPLWSADEDTEPVVKQAVTRNDNRVETAKKDKAIAILQMLEREPDQTASENKLSGNHPHQKSFRGAVTELEIEERIEWVEEFQPARSTKSTGGWRLIKSSGKNGEVD